MQHNHHFEGTLHQRSSSIKVILQNRWSSSIKGHLPSKAIFHQRWSSIKGRLPSKVVFHKSRLPSEVTYPQRSSSISGLLSSKVHQRSSSIKGRLSSKVVLHRRSSSIRAMCSISRHICLFPSRMSITICWLNHMTMLNACAETHAFASLTQWKW